SQLAKALGLTRPRIHYLIRLGLFQSHYDAARDVHLFPDQPELLEELRQRDLARRQAHNRPPPLGCLGGTTLSSPSAQRSSFALQSGSSLFSGHSSAPL